MKKVTLYNPRYPHIIKVYRESENDDPFEESGEDEIIYNGEGRSFINALKTGDGKVITNQRKIAIPKTDWDKAIIAGDLIEITKGNIKENGKVIDWEVGNFDTVIYWEYGRN